MLTTVGASTVSRQPNSVKNYPFLGVQI